MKILAVDDDRRIVRTTCDILKIKGHETSAAYSGEEGVEKVKTDPPECVLMDIKMPGIDGIEATRRMKAIVPALPIILVTAYATDELVDEAKRAGAYAILSKPLNFPMILSFLSLLRRKERILVVDADPIFCETLKKVLTLRGYRVETESEPSKVISHLAAGEKLVIILDLDLDLGAGVGGTDVLDTLHSKYPTKPAVVATSYRKAIGNSIAEAMKVGAYTCLYKPLEIETLLQLIEEIRLKKLQSMLSST